MRQPSLRHPTLLLDDPPVLQPLPPAWVARLLGDAPRAERSIVQMQSGEELSLMRAQVEGAAHLSADELRQAVTEVYAKLGDTLATIDRAPLRMWNYMPLPTAQLDTGRDRYMAFNQGRGDGYRHWPARALAGHTRFPTASAVGINGDDLIVFCLASTDPGTPIENPRQIPAWRYSTRYGPIPPSFARATVATIAGRRLLLIGGTASVVGEDTAHVDDIRGQLAETLDNLAAVIANACRDHTAAGGLTRMSDLRAYLTRPQDAALVRERLFATCPHVTNVELVIAPLCRTNLLVEIEGVADVTPPA